VRALIATTLLTHRISFASLIAPSWRWQLWPGDINHPDPQVHQSWRQMKRFLTSLALITTGMALTIAGLATRHFIARRMDAGAVTADAMTPEPETYIGLHQAIMEAEKRDPPDVLFLGDSITDFWRSVPWQWQEKFGRFHPCNAGIVYDQIQHLLWRVQNGELDGIHPRVIVLEVGTNNLGIGHDDPKTIAAGIRHLIAVIQARQPDAKILLLGIFPRRDLPQPAIVSKTNSLIAELADGDRVVYLDVGRDIPAEDFPDAIHPNPEGYSKWADGMLPTMEGMLAHSTDRLVKK
jgi:beta-glucosidase